MFADRTSETTPVAYLAVAMAVVVMATVGALQDDRGGLSDVERQIAAHVDAGNDSSLALLERVVNMNSGTLNLDGVRRVGQQFRTELDHLGFATRWVDGASWERAGHLVANHPGDGPRILLIGHLDTVFERDNPFQQFERLANDAARGPGITDMKGGDVIIVGALKALEAAGQLARMNLIVVMTGDEEAPGLPIERAREALVSAATGADIAVGFEDGPADPRYAVTARRGALRWELTVKGATAHSSQVFSQDVGYGAIFETARILNAFRERLAGEPHLTFNPGAIVGGTAADLDSMKGSGTASGKANVVAGQTRVAGDLRVLDLDQLRRARETMEDIVKASLPRTSATLTFEDGYPPMSATPGNASLLAAYSQVSRDLGTGTVSAVDPDRAGAADVSFVAGRVRMTIDGIGLSGRGGHTPDEIAELSKLPSQTKRAALLLYRLSRQTVEAGSGATRH
jgi:glutamate carboxypeptidase